MPASHLFQTGGQHPGMPRELAEAPPLSIVPPGLHPSRSEPWPPTPSGWVLATKGTPHPAPRGHSTWQGIPTSAPRAPSPGSQFPGKGSGALRMAWGLDDEATKTPPRAAALTSPAVRVWGTPARTLLGLPSGHPPQPPPPCGPTTGQRSLQGGMMASRPWGSEGQPVPPPLPALRPKVKGTTKQAGHCPGSPLGRVCSGSEETQAGRAVGLGTSPVCTGRARHSRGVGGPRQGQTQLVDMPLGGLGWEPTPPSQAPPTGPHR